MCNVEHMSWTWAETKAAGILPKESEKRRACATRQRKPQREKASETVIERRLKCRQLSEDTAT